MRSVTIAEAEQNPTNVFECADREPVRILRDGRDLIVVTAAEFEQTQEQARRQRVQNLLDSMERCSSEAIANGMTEEMIPEFLR